MRWGFLLKKLLTSLLDPTILALFLLLAGGIFIWRNRRPAVGKFLLMAAFFVLIVFSTSFLPRLGTWYQESLYQTYRTSPENTIDYIVVLGGGYGYEASLPPSQQLSVESLARLVEGIRLLNEHPSARLIVTGGGPEDEPTNAEVFRDAAVMLGVARDRIILESRAWDTHAEAEFVRELVEPDDTLLLVTSATHMRRALGMFRKQGLNVMPAPAVRRIKGDIRIGFLPSSANLYESNLVIREWIGVLWARLRGQM